MDHIDEGNNGRLYTSKAGVIKVQKRKSLGHDVMTQKKIHLLLETLIHELHLEHIHVPKVHLENKDHYEMDIVNTEKILYLGDLSHSTEISQKFFELIVTEFTRLWIALFKKGYAAWDMEFFLQPDGKIMLLDFDKYGIVSNRGTTIVMPHWSPSKNQENLKYFFQNSCFPRDFTDRLLSLGFTPPPCLTSL